MGTHSPDVGLESAVMSDVDRLVELWVALARDQRAYDSHLEADANRPQVKDALARHIVVDGVLVARAESTIVGFVMFGLEHGDYEQSITRGVVHDLFVVPEWRSEGIGEALLSRAEASLAQSGADVVSLEVMATNEDATRFYRRHGYRAHRMELEKPARSDTHSKEDG